MIIQYTKKALNTNLYFGMGWISFAFVFYFINSNNIWYHLGYAGIGVAFLLLHFFMKNRQYGILTSELVKQNSAFQKELPISELIEIKEFAGDIIFKSLEREIAFDTKIIDQQSLVNLKSLISKIKSSNANII